MLTVASGARRSFKVWLKKPLQLSGDLARRLRLQQPEILTPHSAILNGRPMMLLKSLTRGATLRTPTIVRRAVLRRVLASLTLAGLVLSLAAPLLLAGGSSARDCPFAPATGLHGAVLANALPEGDCEHTVPGPCVATLGCVTVAPAIALVPTLLAVPNNLIALAPRPAPHFGDLFRTGPPTPPPNHS